MQGGNAKNPAMARCGIQYPLEGHIFNKDDHRSRDHRTTSYATDSTDNSLESQRIPFQVYWQVPTSGS